MILRNQCGKRLSTLPALVILGSSPLQYETNPQAKAELLQKRFFLLPPDADLSDITAANYPTPIKVDQITITEVHQAIMRPAPFKAPGPTIIPNIILQHLALILSPLLQRIFNSSSELGYYTKLFRNSVTISMQKSQKDDYTHVKSYRPIALLDIIGKVLELILAKRISALAEIYHLLPKTHFGRRRNTSTEHAVQYLVEKTYAAWAQGKEASALTLDVTGVFDNVSHPRLIYNLRKRQLDPKMIAWIASFMQDRTTIVKTTECSTDPIHIRTEIPQGSPLSPILYLFYNVDLLEICSSFSTQLTVGGFIDDTILLATGSSIEENCEKLKESNRLCIDWAKKYVSKFDPSKYQLVHLSRKRNTDINWELVISGNHIIKAQKSGILLGVEIDNQLKWKNHLERIKIRASKSITALSCLAGSVWGGRLKTIRLLYQSIIIPQLTYYCSVWYPPPNELGHRKYVLKSLQSIQGRVLKVVTGAFKATSLPALDIEAFVMPIRQRLDKLFCESLLRIVSSQLYETIVT